MGYQLDFHDHTDTFLLVILNRVDNLDHHGMDGEQGMTLGYQLDQWLSLRLLDNVILDFYLDLPCVLPYAVYVDLEHLETQDYLGLLSEPCTPVVTISEDHLKLPW